MVIMTLVSVHILQSCHYFCNFIAFNSKTENLILLSTHLPYACLIVDYELQVLWSRRRLVM